MLKQRPKNREMSHHPATLSFLFHKCSLRSLLNLTCCWSGEMGSKAVPPPRGETRRRGMKMDGSHAWQAGPRGPGGPRAGEAREGRGAGCAQGVPRKGKVLRISWGRRLVGLKEHLREARPALPPWHQPPTHSHTPLALPSPAPPPPLSKANSTA